MFARTLIASALLALGALGAALAQTVERPERQVEDPGVITTRQAITPAGVQSVFKGRVHAATFGEEGEIFVLSRTHLYRMNWLENRVLASHALAGAAGVRGLVYDAASKRALATAAASQPDGKPPVVQLVGLAAQSEGETLASDLGRHIAGSPALADGQALVPLTFDNALAVTPLAGGQARIIPVGIAPVAVAAAHGFAYVANWGVAPLEGEISAPTGLADNADKLAIDARGIAKAGTVSVVDLARGAVVATIPVGRHPTAVALDAKHGRLFVANANDDTVSVIDVRRRRVVRTLTVQPFAAKTDGVAPTALAYDAARDRLLIACGGINAVAVYDLSRNRIAGLIPTSWYPVSVALSQDGAHIAVATLLGLGSGQNDGPTKRFVHANRGAVHVVASPDDAQLASYTTAVMENNRMAGAPVATSANRRAPPRAIPVRAGEPSLIEHVVYIIKENRTYDQVFGDLERGNGEPSFVMYGEDVAPNTRALARQFVLLDNFYATGGNSANGHQWVTQANEVSYTLWPGYAGRSYPFDGSDPLAYAKGGFLWDAALARGKTVEVFGEYTPRVSWGDEHRQQLLADWRDGKPVAATWAPTTSPIPALDKLLVREFPGYSMGIPDVVRAQIFLKHLARYENARKMPNLVIIQLPCDHTSGTRPGVSTPEAMVADNDLALGQIVEALTTSRFWPKMAIFVVEDDAQNGVDHVDGHRTIALAISPYARRGAVDSTFYAQQSMVKTIELILGLPTMSLFDLIATDMRASFQETPDVTGFSAIRPQQDLFERNPELAKIAGSQREGAIASAAMRFEVPDAVPSQVLNRILWHDAKGWSTPFPGTQSAVFSPYRSEEEDDADESALTE
jgi:YVTN family beta-propeller protein